MAKRSYKKIYEYKCTITEEMFRRTAKAETPDELVSVKAYYELNPDHDDRPDIVKQKILHEKKETPTTVASEIEE